MTQQITDQNNKNRSTELFSPTHQIRFYNPVPGAYNIFMTHGDGVKGSLSEYSENGPMSPSPGVNWGEGYGRGIYEKNGY